MFSNKAELLPAGETTQEHQDQQREEARILEHDRNNGSLFRGCFRHGERHATGVGNRIIIDEEDGVSRCPRCTWEVEDGECAGCGWPREADSWEGDSVTSLMAAEEYMMRQEMGLDGTEYESETGVDSEELLQEHGDQVEDDSVGSLDEFVVNDEQGQEARPGPRLTRRQIEWRFPRVEPGDSDSGSSHTLSSSMRDVSSERENNAQALDDSSNDGIDEDVMPQFQDSNSMSSSGNRNDRSSDTVGNSHMMLDESDDEVIASNARVRHRRRRQPNRASTTGRLSSRPIPSEVLRISSDSEESVTQPRVRRRANHEPAPNSNRNFRPVRNNEDREENAQQRNSQRRSGERQVSRRSAAHSTAVRGRSMHPSGTDEDDADVDEEDIGQRELHGRLVQRQTSPPLVYDTDDALLIMGREISSLDPMSSNYGRGRQRLSAQVIPQTSNSQIFEQQSNDFSSHLDLDPATSVPVRRENVNLVMPGAFPPSFVSEQGQSQSTPLINFENFTSPPLPHRSTTSRETRYSEGHDQAFSQHRRAEGQMTHATQADHSHRRERSAQKAARRQDRQRVKAEQEARGRRDGEPSAPPLMAL